MSAIDVPDRNTWSRLIRNASALWWLTAAGLFLGSAVLQLVASLQRWVVFRYSRGEFWAEDHRVDYTFPFEPWENIGTAAQFYGVGVMILALGVLAMALGVLAVPRITTRRMLVIVVDVAEIVLAILVAGSFAVGGAHSFVSGLTGTPSSLYQFAALDWVAIVGLIVLSVRWWRKSTAAMIACLLLFGSTGIGFLIAAFFVAPIFAGYVSHDTTPWTETVIAMWTAGAGFAMILAARDAASR